jgi:hypothetical protein
VAAGQQDLQDHFAFGDELSLTPDQILFADVAEGRDARIIRVFYGDDDGQGAVLGFLCDAYASGFGGLKRRSGSSGTFHFR